MITEIQIKKLIETVDCGLVSGLGEPIPGKMCVEAAVCYALGLPHGDNPPCVAPSLARIKIRLNDSRWSSDKARAAGMRKLAVVQLGSAGALDEKEFLLRVEAATIRQVLPRALRNAARVVPLHAGALEQAAKDCELRGDKESAKAAREVARAAAVYDAATHAYAATYAYAYAAASAYDAAYDAATYAYTAYAASASASDATAARDVELVFFADLVLGILVEMNVPGVQWLPML